MAIRVVRLGTARAKGEGVRLGTVRCPPRGVRKSDYAKRDFYDVWLPDLAPGAALFSWFVKRTEDGKAWARFAKQYSREMRAPAADRLLELLARLSHYTNFSVGCYCENQARCHRSILRRLLAEKGAKIIR